MTVMNGRMALTLAAVAFTSAMLVPGRASFARPGARGVIAQRLRALAYAPAPGAHVIGDVVLGPSGHEAAFFEQGRAGYALVVCLEGGAQARWSLSEAATRLQIFWTGASELLLGASLLAPSMRVTWTLRLLPSRKANLRIMRGSP
jgi:hypothetical protein